MRLLFLTGRLRHLVLMAPIMLVNISYSFPRIISRFDLSLFDSAGLIPPVEIASKRLPRLNTLGTMKSDSLDSLTILTKAPSSLALSPMWRFNFWLSVDAMTRYDPFKSPGL